ncbi:MAG: DnaB-like helicase C-terminal domain-containing protein [Syntrophomonas sp.]
MQQYIDSLSEARVLSAMMNSEQACIEAISQLDMEDFGDPLNRDIFGLAASIYADGKQLSYAIFLKEADKYGFINDNKKLEQVQQVIEEFIDDNTVQYWINRVIDKAKARKLYSTLNKYNAMADDQATDIDELLGMMIGDLSSISAGHSKDDFEDGPQIADTLKKLMDEKEARFELMQATGETILEGLSTGFDKLDKYTLGYKPGDLIVLGAQTGHGKTAFSLQTANSIAVNQQNSLLYINTEMSKEIIYQRLAANISGISFYNMRQGNLNGGDGNDRGRFNKALKAIKGSGFIHKYCPELTPARCVIEARKAKIQKKIDIIIIDYVGRMEKFDPKLQEWQVLEQIVKSQKILAQELKIPIIVLAQLNPDGSLQGAKRIKNECDLLLKLIPLTRDEQQDDYSRYKNANYRLYVDKNRDGESDINIPLHFDKAVQRIKAASLKGNQKEWSDIGHEVKRGRNI